MATSTDPSSFYRGKIEELKTLLRTKLTPIERKEYERQLEEFKSLQVESSESERVNLPPLVTEAKTFPLPGFEDVTETVSERSGDLLKILYQKQEHQNYYSFKHRHKVFKDKDHKDHKDH